MPRWNAHNLTHHYQKRLTTNSGCFEGLLGIDWFAQGDGAAVGASTDSFQYMGLYFDYSKAMSVADTKLSPQGEAYAWLSTWLPGTSPDAAALTALALPESVRGAAFKTEQGHALYVLWARTVDDESATTTLALPATGAVTVRRFDADKGASDATLNPTGGRLELALTGMPLVVEL